MRNIHLPPPVSFWPLAYGWYILMGMVLLSSTVLAYWLYKRWCRHRAKRSLLKRFDVIKGEHTEAQPLIAELSVLLRRYALNTFPRKHVAGLTGPAWLKFLDNALNTKDFSQGVGQLLAQGPYQATAEWTQVDALIALMRRTVLALPRHARDQSRHQSR